MRNYRYRDAPHRGFDYYYGCPEDLTSRTMSAWRENREIRAAGANVIASPSLHPSGRICTLRTPRSLRLERTCLNCHPNR